MLVLHRKMSSGIRWTNLNPEHLLSYMNNTFGSEFQFDALQKYMKRVSTAQWPINTTDRCLTTLLLRAVIQLFIFFTCSK